MITKPDLDTAENEMKNLVNELQRMLSWINQWYLPTIVSSSSPPHSRGIANSELKTNPVKPKKRIEKETN